MKLFSTALLCAASLLLIGCEYEKAVCNSTQNDLYAYFKANQGKLLNVVNSHIDEPQDYVFSVKVTDAGNGQFNIKNANGGSFSYEAFSTCKYQGQNFMEFQVIPGFSEYKSKYRLAHVIRDQRQPNRFQLRMMWPDEEKLTQLGIPYDTKYTDGDPINGIKLGIFVKNANFNLEDLISTMTIDQYETYTFEFH
jgi:hypothetical protein